jgi:hypothetical protein
LPRPRNLLAGFLFGFWARLEAGQSPKRITLSGIMQDRVEILAHEKRRGEAFQVDRPVPAIEVTEDRSITHQHAIRIDKSVLRGRKMELLCSIRLQ